jgi:hypothetical protein
VKCYRMPSGSDVEAVQYDGSNAAEIVRWAHAHRHKDHPKSLHVERDALRIETPNGLVDVNEGDWIVKADMGVVFKSEPKVFAANAELIQG